MLVRASIYFASLLTLLPVSDLPAPSSVSIEFMSEGAMLHGNFFPADGAAPHTLLLIPGFPGNPNDVVGLGATLPPLGVNVMMFNPRGSHASEGTFSFANTLADIGAALQWLDRAEIRQRFHVDSTKVALGGHSFGGGMALAYAAKDRSVRRIVSIAGNDHAEFARSLQRDPALAEAFQKNLTSALAPVGPIHLAPEAGIKEISGHPEIYGLRENAANLANRSILLVGGWDDIQATVEQMLLPFYRALKSAGAKNVTIQVYPDAHNFTNVRDQLARDIARWLQGPS